MRGTELRRRAEVSLDHLAGSDCGNRPHHVHRVQRYIGAAQNAVAALTFLGALGWLSFVALFLWVVFG